MTTVRRPNEKQARRQAAAILGKQIALHYRLLRPKEWKHQWFYTADGKHRRHLAILVYDHLPTCTILRLSGCAGIPRLPMALERMPADRARRGLELSFLPDEAATVLAWAVANLDSVKTTPTWLQTPPQPPEYGTPLNTYMWTKAASAAYDADPVIQDRHTRVERVANP